MSFFKIKGTSVLPWLVSSREGASFSGSHISASGERKSVKGIAEKDADISEETVLESSSSCLALSVSLLIPLLSLFAIFWPFKLGVP